MRREQSFVAPSRSWVVIAITVIALNVLNEVIKSALARANDARWAENMAFEETHARLHAMDEDELGGGRTLDAKATRARTRSEADDGDEGKGERALKPTYAMESESSLASNGIRKLNPDVRRAIGGTVRERECGSPAIDGYAHVNMTCLISSATNREFDVSREARERQVVWIEENASYDGIAVRWGIHHTTNSATECAEKCKEHEPRNRNATTAEALPCNVFVWCPIPKQGDAAAFRCFEPDAHEHFAGDCWLKFSETPESVEVNQRGANDAVGFTNDRAVSYAQRHAKMPNLVHWSSGVVLPPGVTPSGGTLGPRAKW